MKLQWAGDIAGQKPIPHIANARANALLAQWPNIQELEIANYSQSCSPFIADFLNTNPAHRLREVRIVDPKMSVNEVAQYSEFRNLETMRVQNIKGSHAAIPQSHNNIDHDDGHATPRLKMLDFGPYTHLTPSTLRPLLSIPQDVTALRCMLPGYQPPLKKVISPSKMQMLQPLSPHSIAVAFTPLQNCLVELYLTGGVRTHWPGHDGSRLDLSGFAKLEVLAVPASCFF